MAMTDDSIAGIYKSLGDCAAISKYAGGIGLHVHNVRARGSVIRGTNGTSNGLVPMLRVFNNTARYVDQCFTPDTIVLTGKGSKPIKDWSGIGYSAFTIQHVLFQYGYKAVVYQLPRLYRLSQGV
jgi:hypothetical protein